MTAHQYLCSRRDNMEPNQTEVQEQTITPSAVRDDAPTAVATSTRPTSTVSPQACASCGAAPAAAAGAPSAPTFVYAIGRIEARFPSISVEKEFAQATGR